MKFCFKYQIYEDYSIIILGQEMDKLSSKLDKFYTDCYDYENEIRNKEANSQADLNTSLEEQFKDLEIRNCQNQSSEYED
ncbi:unnamed protein product (macronuclear) [Paramecium tetraurelia]|uniref:Uncharacterized protein n=1 Tax=Paramecium tetraurelia TaxID=5888 RepID=A0DYC4_PARTE|nr:uncharacterized protein GSPATT00003009001 [Paramecium tetraurelia]CAK88041.1 unnamed protein product [Paramecium tetraurelia]|eukprot:XP_001455438.1 hypothetical protein (macronuclear) [Paramecium tetraurelia strain d4-2]